MNKMTRILKGIKVVDLTQVGAGPMCTRILGDFGAEVIKVEIPKVGEPARTVPPYLKGQSYYFTVMNTNKKSITLNLRSEKGAKIFRELLGRAHVLVENFTPGVMKRLKIGYEEVREINPGIIYLSISGFGQEGPYRSYPTYDPIIQAMGGAMALTGEADGPPMMSGVGLADWMTGMSAAVATLAAVIFWKNTEKGQHIDLSMQDCVWLMAAQGHFSAYFAKGEIPSRTGNYLSPFAPYNCYKAKDGYIFISIISNVNWQGLLKAMGKEDLIEDPDLSRLKGRRERLKEIDQMVQAWVGDKTIEEIRGKLLEERVPSGPVLTFDKLIADPNLLARQMIVDIEQPGVGTMKIPGSPFKFSESPVAFKLPAPSLGEHNAEIYSDLLGLSKEDLTSLEEEGVI